MARIEIGSPIDLIDVRTPAEFREMHVRGARIWPLDRLDPKRIMSERAAGVSDPMILICRSGSRSEKARQMMMSAGVTNVLSVEGGTLACVAAGLPIVRGKRTISLERQVRIAAGSLVILGCLLGAFVHPYLIALAGLIGAGLVISGITDTCGMAMVLARMPWNQAGGEAAAG
jgi:rhodanese-related sulfurtransferase